MEEKRKHETMEQKLDKRLESEGWKDAVRNMAMPQQSREALTEQLKACQCPQNRKTGNLMLRRGRFAGLAAAAACMLLVLTMTGMTAHAVYARISAPHYPTAMEGIALDAAGDITGNKAVDALLYQKRKQAEAENIIWECDVQMPKESCINEFDLCVLFGNILDNALEACGRMQRDERRFINIQAKTVKKCFLLEVKNSMDRTEKFTEGFTNKDDSQEHGIGLLNVGDVVNRYNGAVHKEAGKGIFVISILMPFPDTAHDTKTAV